MAPSSLPFPAATADQPAQILVFTLDERDFALAISAVERVVRMAEPTPLPAAPAIVGGMIDLAGDILPLLDVRRRFRLPSRPPRVSDKIIVAHTAKRRVALAVDSVFGLVPLAAGAVLRAEDVVPGLEYVAGITRLPGRDLVLIHDLDRFLSLEEDAQLERAIADVS